jgi:trimethylamine--corrinoid protein Co-methyltransferase
MPELLDNNSFEQWELDGAKDANARGLEAARHLLANYEPPPLDPAIDEASDGQHRFLRARGVQH